MKKFMSVFIVTFTLCFLISLPSFAKEEPIYDDDFRVGQGAFFARGNDIVIDINDEGNTIIKWDNGSMVVPKNTVVFGGGEKSNYETTNITMNNGEVAQILAAGWGDANMNAEKVENATITINGGIVSDCVAGGGALYAEVNNSNIVINNGNIKEVYGGGLESIVMDNVRFDAGSEDNLEGSGNRVNHANITINQITMPSQGTVYGGGDNFAYVGETNITINNGNLSEARIVAGGENGYVGESHILINGGNIGSYQSLQKGLVESVAIEVKNGNIGNFYIGAEKDEEAKTKQVNQVTAYLLDGNIQNLSAGINAGAPMQIDPQKDKILITEDMKVENETIAETDLTNLSYQLTLTLDSLILDLKGSEQISATVSTNPEGYEYLFPGKINFESKNSRIATVTNDGMVTGIATGKTEITVTFLKETKSVSVEVIGEEVVEDLTDLLIFSIILLFITMICIFRYHIR